VCQTFLNKSRQRRQDDAKYRKLPSLRAADLRAKIGAPRRPTFASSRCSGDARAVVSRLRDGALAAFDHQTRARRHAPVRNRDLVDDLEINLPARRRYDVAQVAPLIVGEFQVRLLGEPSLEALVDVVAVAVA